MKTTAISEKRYLSVRQCADQLGLRKTVALLAAIASGELIARNFGSGKKRPHYAIRPADLEAFEEARLVVPVVEPKRASRRNAIEGITPYV